MGFDPGKIQSLLAAGQVDAAVRLCQDAIKQNADDGAAWFGLSLVAEKQGDDSGQIKALQNAVRILGDQPPLLGPLADAYAAVGKLKDAKRLYRQLVDRMPANPLPLVKLATCLSRSGQTSQARNVLEKRIAKAPEQPGLHGALNQLLLEDGRGDAAVDMLMTAAAAQPKRADLWVNLGHAQKNTGALDSAAASYRRALDADPLIGEAYRHLTRLSPEPSSDDLDRRMADVIDDPSIKAVDRADIGFGLFHRYDRAGRHDEAWSMLQTANALMRSVTPYRPDRDAAYSDVIRRTVTADYIRQRDTGRSDNRPIFIVGLPRTGSTLVEQILSSHPDVAPIGESPCFDEALTAILAERGGAADLRRLDSLNTAAFEATGNRYWQATAALRGDSPRHTDKQLANIRNVGLIRLAFPDASIVLCERDDAESLFSSYSMAFGTDQAHSYALDDLVTAYQSYYSLVDHWNAELGDWCIPVRYERLIDDFETECRRLVAACSLDWSKACLQFYQQKNVVRTASAPQVRQKPYASSLQRSTPYRRWLDPYLAKIKPVKS